MPAPPPCWRCLSAQTVFHGGSRHGLSGYFVLSRSRNVIPLRLRLRFTGQLRQLFLFLVRLSSWPLQQRQGLAIQVLAGTETVSELARQHEVSRKFLYQQVHTAEEALSAAFALSR